MSLPLLAATLLGPACSKPAKQPPPPPALAPSTPPPAPHPPPSEDEQVKPPADEPAELTAIKARVVQGDRSTRTLKELQKLSYKYPKNAEVAYILGQFYCGKLWMKDGLEYYRRAIQLDPSFRTNPYLIKSAVAGLGNDGDHAKVERFLAQDIGAPAAPFLEEVLQGTWRQQVKDRAAAILRELK